MITTMIFVVFKDADFAVRHVELPECISIYGKPMGNICENQSVYV